MPLYEYQCEKEECAKVFEKRMHMVDSTDYQDCPTCGGRAVRIVSANSRQATQWAEPVSTKSPVLEKFRRK